MGITSRLIRTLVTPLTLGAMALCISFQAHSEDPIKTDLDASNIQDFTGIWTVAMDMMGRIMEFEMKVVDIDGKAGATFDSERQAEPIAVEQMELLDSGALQLSYDMPFGDQTFSLIVTAQLSDDGLEGEIVEKSGLFKAPFTAKESIDDPETNGQRRRNRMIAATSANLRFDKDKIRITFSDLEVDSTDYKAFQNISTGTVFEYAGGRAFKILTDIDLDFGGTLVKQGNAYADYPGVYSIWMKKTATGWNLVFNEEADVWGTMFNPETQVYEVPLTVSTAEESADKMLVKMEKVGDNGGKINIFWADKVYTAEFTAKAKAAETAS